MAELDRNMSEGERRDIVRALANRTARSGEILETTVQPQYDYAAAAQAAMAADPVDIPPEALDDLSARTNAPSEAGSRYAEAQRAIFEAGRGREGGYNDDWMNAQQGVVDASQFALDEYMAAIEAARAGSYAYGPGSGGLSGYDYSANGGVPGDGYESGSSGAHPLTGATGTGPLFLSADEYQSLRGTVGELAALNSPALAGFVKSDELGGRSPIDEKLAELQGRGMTWDMVVDHIATLLSSDPANQITYEQAERLMLAAAEEWKHLFVETFSPERVRASEYQEQARDYFSPEIPRAEEYKYQATYDFSPEVVRAAEYQEQARDYSSPEAVRVRTYPEQTTPAEKKPSGGSGVSTVK